LSPIVPGIADQYRIIENTAGWRLRSDRGRLRFDGDDRHAFLQALLTNEVAALASGQGNYSAYLTPQGRLIADLHLFARDDHFIADVPAAGAATLADTFDKLVFTEQVRIVDVSAALSQLSVVGGQSHAILGRALGLAPRDLGALPVWSQIAAGSGFVARTDDASTDSYDVIVPASEVGEVIGALARAGAVELTDELAIALRIDAGRPAFGVDMDSETIPLEAGILERAISTSKGCYVGQEVIIRILHRGAGRVVRRLVKLAMDSASSARPSAGSIVRAGDREVGHVTSVASSLDGTGLSALAYVHRDFAAPDQLLSVEAAPGSVPATVTALAG
jgi:folate-binding protein YgfZ